MEFSRFQIYNYVEEVERFTDLIKHQLKEDKDEIENVERKVATLLNSFYSKESNGDSDSLKQESNGDSDSLDPMRISLPSKSLFDSIFKEDTQTSFLFSEDGEEKRKRLAAERRAEYNAYLERKEQELFAKRKVHEDMSTTTTPRSILESVDYETVLAKRKEEESKFRLLNYAEPSLRINNHEVPLEQTIELYERIHPSEYNSLTNGRRHSSTESNSTEEKNVISPSSVSQSISRGTSNRPLSIQEQHIRRTGGGGEPVKDSFGNLITSRGYKDIAPALLLPSFKQDLSSNKKESYREELARQIEEKKRLAALEKVKAQESENRTAQRIEEQRRRMQLEYENELKVNTKAKEQIQQERLRKLEEFQKNDADMRQKSRGIKTNEANNVTEQTNSIEAENSRSSSPPVPAVRSKVIFEKAVPALSAAKRLSGVAVKPENIFSTIAEIRKKIMQDQQNLNRELNGSYEVMNRRTVQDILVDDDDEEDYNIKGVSEPQEILKT